MRSLDPAECESFADVAVIESAEVLERFRAAITPGLVAADERDLEQIDEPLPHWLEAGGAFERHTLIVAGRHDTAVG